MEQFPFLREADFDAAFKTAQNRLRLAGEDGERLPDEHPDSVLADVMAELEAMRVAWEFQEDEVTCYFYVRIRGGQYVAKLHADARVHDRAIALARAHVTAWCDSWSWPTSKSFSFAEYGDEGAMMLAREWCRKDLFLQHPWLL